MSKHRMTCLGDIGPQRLTDIVSGKLLVRQSNAKMSKAKFYFSPKRKIRTFFDFEFPEDVTREEFAEWVAEGMNADMYDHTRFVVFVDDLDEGAEVVDVKADPGPPIEIDPPGLSK